MLVVIRDMEPSTRQRSFALLTHICMVEHPFAHLPQAIALLTHSFLGLDVAFSNGLCTPEKIQEAEAFHACLAFTLEIALPGLFKVLQASSWALHLPQARMAAKRRVVVVKAEIAGFGSGLLAFRPAPVACGCALQASLSRQLRAAGSRQVAPLCLAFQNRQPAFLHHTGIQAPAFMFLPFRSRTGLVDASIHRGAVSSGASFFSMFLLVSC